MRALGTRETRASWEKTDGLTCAFHNEHLFLLGSETNFGS